MPSFERVINQSRQFIIAVKVFLPTLTKDEFDAVCVNATNYRALVDTGANTCAISNQIVDDLELLPHKKLQMMTAGTPHDTFAYLVGIAVPVTDTEMRPEMRADGNVVVNPVTVSEMWRGFQQTEVTSFPDVGDRGFDIILGMDMLETFHITIYEKHIIISI